MAVYELSDVSMVKSGESLDFVHAVLLESKVEDNVHYDLVLKNVVQHQMFYDNMQNEEPVAVTFTTINNQKGQATMEVRTVNKRETNDNTIELVTRDRIEFL